MVNSLSKIEHLRERCTGVAKEFFTELERHPHFSEVVEILDKVDGPISRADIEDAFIQVARKRARPMGKLELFCIAP